jgi:hypothetical protein
VTIYGVAALRKPAAGMPLAKRDWFGASSKAAGGAFVGNHRHAYSSLVWPPVLLLDGVD